MIYRIMLWPARWLFGVGEVCRAAQICLFRVASWWMNRAWRGLIFWRWLTGDGVKGANQ